MAFTCGTMVEACTDGEELLARQGIELAVINLHTIKPMDTDLVCRYAATGAKLFSGDEHSIIGGLGDALECQGTYRLTKIGLQDCFGQSGKPEAVLREYGLCADQIAAEIQSGL